MSAPRPVPDVVVRLRAAGCVFAEEEARLLAEAAVSPAALEGAVQRRVAGEPLETILGWVEFAGRRLGTAPGVFVPRRRTQLLARLAVTALPSRWGPLVAEICCGAAAVAATVAVERADARIVVADLDPAAVALAQQNVPTAQAFVGDLCDALPRSLRGRLDVLVANAPYVPTGDIALMPSEARDHEPHHALDGGPDGVGLHRRLALQAADWLAADGVLLVETSGRQAALSIAAMDAAGLAARVERDEDLDATVVRAVRRDSLHPASNE